MAHCRDKMKWPADPLCSPYRMFFYNDKLLWKKHDRINRNFSYYNTCFYDVFRRD